jgi:hypothetical protein
MNLVFPFLSKNLPEEVAHMISKMIRFGLVAAILVTTMLLTSPAQAQEPPPLPPTWVYTYPGDGWVDHVKTNESIMMHWWWFAYSPGQVKEFLGAASDVYIITNADGSYKKVITADEARKYFTDPFPANPEVFWNATTPNGYSWASAWEYPLGRLPAGTYTVTFEETLRHTVNDGFHLFRDYETGERMYPVPDIYLPGKYINISTIIVTE